MSESSHPLLRRKDVQEFPFRHPLNPRSEVRLGWLGRATGLERVSVTLARVPPGRESFVYHSHAAEEEWIYVLSGRGVAEIGEEEHEVGPGDFMGFRAPGVAHHLRNPHDEDLVYLMGGEIGRCDVGYFPRLGKRAVFAAGDGHIVDDASLRDFFSDDE